MPIIVDSEIHVFSEDKFHQLAQKIIGITFGVHNEFGRLMDEDVYKQTIRGRCEAAGIVPARREVEIKVIHQDFEKPYFMDLLFAYGLMAEAKTVEKLTPAHHAQTLHYLMLAGMHHGLLLNLRPERVGKRFVSTRLKNLAERRRYEVLDGNWWALNEAGQRLCECFIALLDDWGAFLKTTLYREAIIHFFGGPDVALQRIPIFDGETTVGTHEVCLLADDTALALTGLKSKDSMQIHLQRFISHTNLACIQWINMNGHYIEIQTLTPD